MGCPHLFERGVDQLACLTSDTRARCGDGHHRCSAVVWVWVTLDEAQVLQAVDDLCRPAAAQHESMGDLRHAQRTVGFEIEQRFVVCQQQAGLTVEPLLQDPLQDQ